MLSSKKKSDYLPTDDSDVLWDSRVLNNLPKVGEFILDARDLVQLLLVFHHQYATLAMLQYILASLCTIGGVDTSSKATGKDGTKVTYDPLRRIETKNADAFKPL